MKSVVQADPGSSRTIDVDASGNVTWTFTQDVEPIMDLTHAERDFGTHGDAKWSKLGSVPNVILERWLQDSGLQYGSHEFMAYCVKKLQDRDWRRFQVNPR